MRAISFFLILLTCGCASNNKDPMKGILAQRGETFRQCYYESESYQGKDAAPPESMVVSFTLTREGEVIEEKIVKSCFRDPNLHACILDQIRRIKYEKPGTEIEVYQPIDFAPVVK